MKLTNSAGYPLFFHTAPQNKILSAEKPCSNCAKHARHDAAKEIGIFLLEMLTTE